MRHILRMKSGKYIHQHSDWPVFQVDPTALQASLSQVRFEQGRLLGRLEAMARTTRDRVELKAVTDEVVGSSSIEGERLDRDEVRSSAARQLGLKVAGLVKSSRDVDGVVQMMIDASHHYAKPLTKHRLFAWHRMLFPGDRSGWERITVGNWRIDEDGPMQVVSGQPGKEKVHFRAPPAAMVPAEMDRFLAGIELKGPTDPIVQAGLAHLWFVTIHPFDDGNGRIARAITELALARGEASPRRYYSMSTQIRAERSDYYDVLEATQKGGLDVTEWLAWFISCLGRAIGRASAEQDQLVAITRFREEMGRYPLNTRHLKVLNRMLDGFEGPMTSGKLVKIGKCSQDTATRDLLQMVEWGLLVRGPGGGRSTHYELPAAVSNFAT